MEKKKYELLIEVLRRLQEKGVLNQLILAGSWGLVLYQKYFADSTFYPSLRTRDADFIIPAHFEIREKINIPKLLEDLGFVVDFNRTDNSIRLLHPALIIEFLVAEKGRGSKMSRKIKELGITAQPLRYLNYLESKVVSVDIEGLQVKIPDPAVFALHKLIIMTRRRSEEKREKDKNQAKSVLMYLLEKGKEKDIREAICLMHPKWFKSMLDNLEKEGETELLQRLKQIAPM